MADLKDDIEKYLKGQLSQGEMHALEKKALNDPFLADALEGADSVGAKDFLSDVRELDERIGNKPAHSPSRSFEERPSGSEGKHQWMTVMRIAASVALLLGASYVIYTFVQPSEPATLAKETGKEEAAAPQKNLTPESNAKSPQEKPTEKLLSLNPPPTTQPGRTTRDKANPASGPAQALAITAEPASDSQAAPGFLAEKAVDLEQAKADDIAAAESSEKISSDDQGPSEPKKKDADRHRIPSKPELSVASGQQAFQQVINGKVTDAGDGSPIPGVNVLVEGTSQGVVSDENGNYQLVTDSPGNNLVFSFIGYQTKEVKIPPGESEINVQLPVDVSSLSEVIVAGYSKGEGESAHGVVPIQLAEPVGGKRAYHKYLEKNLHYPQQALDKKIEGRVTVEFTVKSDGALSNFVVVRGLDPSCNEEVIRLVKAGPQWKPSSEVNVPMNTA